MKISKKLKKKLLEAKKSKSYTEEEVFGHLNKKEKKC